MGFPVVAGDKCLCCFGTQPATLNAKPGMKIKFQNKPCLTLTDTALGVNIMPPFFGNCIAPTNPSKPPLPPAPCAPVLSPWQMPTTKTTYSSYFQLAMKNSICQCSAFQGVITLISTPSKVLTN